MPSLSDYKKLLSQDGKTMGQILKNNSDMIMEQTWDRDIQSKKCYIYDYYHDDKPWMNSGMTYENTTKTLIDAKFIISQSQSIDKDRVTVMLQFRPSQKIRFQSGDDLYYYETDYKNKYNSNFPIGMYCDIPDEDGIYHKWLICAKQISNQFVKYLILPTNYRFTWIETEGSKRIIQRVWGVTRSQNSYNSGLWTAYYATEVENQFKAILPMNSITEKIFYINAENQNQRLIISSMIQNPRTWQVSKVEDMLMGEFGLMKLTFVQVAYNKTIDYVDFDAKNPDGSKDVYAMYANYKESILPSKETSFENKEPVSCTLKSSTNTIKLGGSYKTIIASFVDKNNVDVTEKYLPLLSTNCWRFFIDDKEYKNGDLITVLEQSVKNQIKIKIASNFEYLSKKLLVKCNIDNIEGTMLFEIINL